MQQQHRQAKKVFSDNLRAALARSRISQSELARRTNLSRDAIATYVNERSLPSGESLKKIARVLKTEAATLLPDKLINDNVNRLSISVDGTSWILDLRMRVPDGEVLNKVVELLRPYVDV
jgi:transcriptional regulator with XRE-family HTH domain